MSKTAKHRPDLAPVPWLLLAFLLGVSAGLLLSMSQTARAADSPAERSEPPVKATAVALPREPEQREEPEQPVLTGIGTYTVTAYCPCQQCCGKAETDPLYGITATGTTATEGRTIAVDPGVIPYGSVVYFEGLDGCIGGYVAEDCGGAVRGNHIDLYMNDHETALAWGVRELEVYICE